MNISYGEMRMLKLACAKQTRNGMEMMYTDDGYRITYRKYIKRKQIYIL